MNEQRLESEAQRQVAEWVRGLPSEEPSLVWRAKLNEGVRAEAARRTRVRRRWLFASPALGLATTAALALVLFMPRPSPVVSPAAHHPQVEAKLYALYEDSRRMDDIIGPGMRPSEANVSAPSVPDVLEDLEAL